MKDKRIVYTFGRGKVSIFTKLFEMIHDADNLLSLEPEELAGPLLISLEGSQHIAMDYAISADAMLRGGPCESYSTEVRDKILFALMEAWQWLEREGFVAPRPTVLSRTITNEDPLYFVTRRGKRIDTPEAFEVYRKANILPKRQLHPIISQKIPSLFLQGDYDTAVFQAFKEVEIAVRKEGNYTETDIGVHLIRKAFHPENGNLTDQNQQPAERESIAHLFAGAIGYCKNPPSHREVNLTAGRSS